MDTSRHPRVVVGVDGSPGSRVALVHARHGRGRARRRAGRRRGLPLTYVYTGGLPMHVPDEEPLRKDTESRAQDLIADVRHELTGRVPGLDAVDLDLTVTAGHPVPVLLDVAENADLLVVGSRGRGAMRSVLLGSVALHCAMHAAAPVMVVHPTPAG